MTLLLCIHLQCSRTSSDVVDDAIDLWARGDKTTAAKMMENQLHRVKSMNGYDMGILYYNYGSLKKDMHEFQTAEHYLRLAMQHMPPEKHFMVRWNLGSLSMQSGDLRQGISLFMEVLNYHDAPDGMKQSIGTELMDLYNRYLVASKVPDADYATLWSAAVLAQSMNTLPAEDLIQLIKRAIASMPDKRSATNLPPAETAWCDMLIICPLHHGFMYSGVSEEVSLISNSPCLCSSHS